MLLLLTLTAVLAALTSWLSGRSKAPSPQQGETAQQQPDYFLHGLSATVTDRQGKPSHRLLADSLFHYPQKNVTELEQPDITVFGGNNNHWQARAEQGTLQGEGEQILLQGDVRLNQHGEQRLDLHTEWLHIDINRHYAETDAAVLLTSPAARVEGIGMQAYGKEQRLQLLSAVRGYYEID
ncbi:MAG: LPS export ABC transporter periplasmic protein LptC [Gammaproteobacteria bacterium]|nr:LPS export ABC transporter periplasmic protein LptC [Gammaproteobacteria bacterium]MCW8841248.1 LPS export ABC transporter periplasmic protein LptC [Gammaproteobacteria bacterium]MCW8928109.1 LPS export ABC transporter periplasmic protein LptC [Gammaproteobacteria bacterium]MCW8958173.1 LPS export ABC transporter periplasmic protein LptC [Gammaproteobacteria bacterium]MCW8973244.1 LPS export ABC transporter periplasmic protein LptC [Gammaproteobacteria bacterium]